MTTTIQLSSKYKVNKIQLPFFSFEKANTSLCLGNDNCNLELDEQVAREEFQTIVNVEKEEDDCSIQLNQRRTIWKLWWKL